MDDAHDIFSGGDPACVVAGEFGVRVLCEIVRAAVGVGGARQSGDAENLRQQYEGIERRVSQDQLEL